MKKPNKIRKLFGGIELSWKKIIFFALLSGVYTAAVAMLPQLAYTSLNTIAVTFEVWILFGILIITNAKSNKDSAAKCFVFFLISQPIVYLLQVPFSSQGWGLFRYYKYWFIWTLLCLPMGYIGYYIKKDKWYGYLILLPMIIFTLSSYKTYLTYFTFDYPNYLLISVFCVVMSVLYPNVLFKNKKIKTAGSIISVVLICAITVFVFIKPYHYSTEILSSIDGHDITSAYHAELENAKYGDICIKYVESVESYMVHVDFKKSGKTKLFVTTPEGNTKVYALTIEHDTYSIEQQNN